MGEPRRRIREPGPANSEPHFEQMDSAQGLRHLTEVYAEGRRADPGPRLRGHAVDSCVPVTPMPPHPPPLHALADEGRQKLADRVAGLVNAQSILDLVRREGRCSVNMKPGPLLNFL